MPSTEAERSRVAERQRRYATRRKASGDVRVAIWLPNNTDLIQRVRTYAEKQVKKYAKEG